MCGPPDDFPVPPTGNAVRLVVLRSRLVRLAVAIVVSLYSASPGALRQSASPGSDLAFMLFAQYTLYFRQNYIKLPISLKQFIDTFQSLTD